MRSSTIYRGADMSAASLRHYHTNKERLRPGRTSYTRERRRKHRALVQAIKMEKGCADCGFNEHYAALEFDHLDPTTKRYPINKMYAWSWKAIEAEMAKCDVVCANCHAMRTARR